MTGKSVSSRTLPGYAVGGCLLLIFSEVLLFLRVPFVRDYFYILAWWPYILLADGLVYRKSGFSIIRSRPASFLDLLSWSVTFWLIFELFNIRLSNWHYVNLVPYTPFRWVGYSLSFATVLPGLFETFLLLKGYTRLGKVKNRLPVRVTNTVTLTAGLMATGILFLILPLAFPRYCYPLIWGAFVLFLEPLNLRARAPSLMEDLAKGRSGKIVLLLASGLVCGFLWEFWNYWSESKWIYTVPFVGNLKIFEMPLPGFLGFPPFALECYVMYSFVCGKGLAVHWDPDVPQGKIRIHRALSIGLQLIFWLFCFYLIDRYTVASFSLN